MRSTRGKDWVVLLIGGFKLAKGLMLVALAVGAFRLFNRDLGDFLSNLADRLGVDPGSHFCQVLFAKVPSIAPKLPLLATGTLFYGALFCVEGTGLLLRKRWAEYLTVIATGSFLPLEGYELARHMSIVKVVVTVLNAAIVVYLIVRLRRKSNKS
jgi:uncharacterized membrane protein (DUF2068 family)